MIVTVGARQGYVDFEAHPNIEVRVFNLIKVCANLLTRWTVFCPTEYLASAHAHQNVLADGVLGITGGRNLSDRYSMQAKRIHFSDMDVLLSRARGGRYAKGFDVYWNSKQVMAWDDFDAKYLELRREQIAKMLLSTNRLTRKEQVQRHPYLQVPQANRGQHVGRSGEPHGVGQSSLSDGSAR